MYLIFDTETTGLPRDASAPLTQFDNWPRLVQLAWQLHDEYGKLISYDSFIVKPEGFTIPFNAEKIHGISTRKAKEVGLPLDVVLQRFSDDLLKAKSVVGHNIGFDNRIVGVEFLRLGGKNLLEDITSIDTASETVEFCKLQGGIGGRLKLPKLSELYFILFDKSFDNAHDAAYDVDSTAKIFFECVKKNIIPLCSEGDRNKIAYEAPQLTVSNFAETTTESEKQKIIPQDIGNIDGVFCHLHGHSQYSVLQATSDIAPLIEKAKQFGMPALAITDLGNLFSAFKFVKLAHENKIKPIIGCEFYVAEERERLKFTKDNPDKRFRQVLLSKSKKGYQNLVKLSTIAFKEGNYGNFPRIDKALIEQYSEGLIALSGSVYGEIPNLILNVGEHQAEEALLWWKSVFGEDFYFELNDHGLDTEKHLNQVLKNFSKQHQIKCVAANEFYFLEREDYKAHDILICIKENEKINTPVGRGRGYRIGTLGENYYFKSQEEVKGVFSDFPEAIENISEILDKVQVYEIKRDVLLPKFEIPKEFITKEGEEYDTKEGENSYLRHLAYEGAKKRYKTTTEEIKKRIDFELETIKYTGYPGYFLIVQDFTSKARELGVTVGPGRGSAAGSVVAYCIGITNIDPLQFDLLFERFLNPDRISLPDIDIDFDNEGREKVIQYVIEKYGEEKVAQIITYGKMAPKSAIRDVGRVMELPLDETGKLAKKVPDRPGTTFVKAFKENKELEEIKKEDTLRGAVLNQAVVLEGSLRNTGVHPCGIIIAPEDISNYVPLARAKDAELLVTQFDNDHVESAGLLKMDFLSLKMLTIIQTALTSIKKRFDVEINLDHIPLDDEKTYQLYQRGDTNGTFQFESVGMQKHLRALKPDRFEDLIAMNALYRPGPMAYIPNFIARKHGKQSITYDFPEFEEFLKDTYGITIYQEQVMLLSQKIANFTKGEADILRKAMGKKDRKILEEMKPRFINQAVEKGFDAIILEKVWKDWNAFADYAFNKSHSTCYSVIAYHTSYLKANYPTDYMMALLSHNQGDIDKLGFFMDECKKMNISVLGPHINESEMYFTVNQNGEIRFGLAAIKGTGEAAVEAVIEERQQNGHFTDFFNFSKRVNLRAVNKKSFECFAKSGAFDCFEQYHRRQYLEPTGSPAASLIEKAIKYASKVKKEEQSLQNSLFGATEKENLQLPGIDYVEPFQQLEKLRIEKEILGLYISGHPLSQYKFEMEHIVNTELKSLLDLSLLGERTIRVGGMITSIGHMISKNGKPYGKFIVEDFNGSYEFVCFSDEYIKFKSFFEVGWFVFMEIIVRKQAWGEGNLSVKILNMEMMSEVREKMVKEVRLLFSLSDINSQRINILEEMIQKSKGKSKISISINDSYHEVVREVTLLSRNYLIHPSDSFFEDLDKVAKVNYKIIIDKK